MNIRVILLFFIVSAATASTKLFVLGTGTPNPNPERMGSSYLVLANDEPYLFDFGTGVIRRIAAFSPINMLISSFLVTEIIISVSEALAFSNIEG